MTLRTRRVITLSLSGRVDRTVVRVFLIVKRFFCLMLIWIFRVPIVPVVARVVTLLILLVVLIVLIILRWLRRRSFVWERWNCRRMIRWVVRVVVLPLRIRKLYGILMFVRTLWLRKFGRFGFIGGGVARMIR